MASLLKFLTAGLLVASAAAHPVQVRPSPVQKRSSSSTKRGAAYNDATLVSALTDSSSVISWAYNWGSTIDGDIPSGVEYVPMLWGSDDVDSWAAAVKTALADGSTHLMGFNEPDSSSQADMTYSDAATYYKEYITIYSDDATLVSPAVTSSTTTGEGLSWLSSFLSECTDCEISVVAIHWYGGTFAELKTFVEEAIETASDYGISEVWLTEFGLDTDESGITDLSVAATFVQEASTWLETKSAITRYAFFYCADDFMLTDGVANSVGNAYVSVSGTSSSSSSESSSSASTSTTTSASTSTSTTVSVATETISSSASETSTSVSVSIEVLGEVAAESSSSSSSSAALTTSSTSTVTLTMTTTHVATTSATTSAIVSSTPTPSAVAVTSATPSVTPSSSTSATPTSTVEVVPTVYVTQVIPVMACPTHSSLAH
ncbi:hypothetical protein N7490_002584 [Penicillium lividum]|nr:hypothetical protein N7490_002584 [Penicillium lividum]